MNHSSQTNSDVDQTFFATALQYFKYEKFNPQDNIVHYLLNDPTYGSFNLFNKLSVKMLMVSIIEKSLRTKIT